jgi:Uma2 family endonuclease
MAVKTLISEEEYLHTSFLDRVPEYIDGELVERAGPNNRHSRTQSKLTARFERLGEQFPVFPRPELRVPVAPGRYRIVDLAVYAHQEPVDDLPRELPLVVIEIVSPDDRHEDIMERLEDFRVWGVPHVWLVDPGIGRMYVYRDASLTAVAAFELPEFGARIAATEVLPSGLRST